MKLTAISIQNYRSIKEARKIRFTSYTTLVGPNNEGKSNVLRAIQHAMSHITDIAVYGRRRGLGPRMMPGMARNYRRDASYYDWEQDFPIDKQDKPRHSQTSTLTLEFQLSAVELQDF